jgi:non-ribosomal peptide synthetase component E (peptide arylation enzyme)
VTSAETVAGLLAGRAVATPGARMVVDGKSHHHTFGQIALEAERVAAGLLARGVEPGDVVSWQLPNGIETITLTLALARLGVVQNPLVMMNLRHHLRPQGRAAHRCRPAGRVRDVLRSPGDLAGRCRDGPAPARARRRAAAQCHGQGCQARACRAISH